MKQGHKVSKDRRAQKEIQARRVLKDLSVRLGHRESKDRRANQGNRVRTERLEKRESQILSIFKALKEILANKVRKVFREKMEIQGRTDQPLRLP